ncbi:hypothetical protein RYX36_035531 [Vicia faba]
MPHVWNSCRNHYHGTVLEKLCQCSIIVESRTEIGNGLDGATVWQVVGGSNGVSSWFQGQLMDEDKDVGKLK